MLFTEDIFKTVESDIFLGAIIIYGLFRFMGTYSYGQYFINLSSVRRCINMFIFLRDIDIEQENELIKFKRGDGGYSFPYTFMFPQFY